MIPPTVPGFQGLFGSLPGISQLPLDLGFSCFIVRDPPAATRLVSFGGIGPFYSQFKVWLFVAKGLPDEICSCLLVLLSKSL